MTKEEFNHKLHTQLFTLGFDIVGGKVAKVKENEFISFEFLEETQEVILEMDTNLLYGDIKIGFEVMRENESFLQALSVFREKTMFKLTSEKVKADSIGDASKYITRRLAMDRFLWCFRHYFEENPLVWGKEELEL